VTFEQQAKLFREKQDKLISKYEIVFGLVFARQLRKFSKAVNDFPTGAIYEIDIYFDEKPLAKAYETMVRETANKFQIKDPSILTKSITADVWRTLVNSYLSGIGGERITEINKFTKEYVLKRLRPILAEGINQGLGIAQIGRSIVSDIAEYSGKFAKYRSERIARTEIVGTSNWASVTSVESSGVKDRILKKWLVTEDGRERETHQEMMDHPLIPIDDYFEVRNVKGGVDRMKYPGDPNGSAGNVIQCRCTVVYERVENSTSAVESNNTNQIAPVKTFKEPISITGDQNQVDKYRELIFDTYKELDLKTDLKIEFVQNIKENGSVSWVKQSDNTYKMGNLIKVNPKAENINEVIRHEMRHIYQSEKKGFMIKGNFMSYEGKEVISIQNYNKILNGTRSNVRATWEKNIIKYINLPWEIDADNFAELIRIKKSLIVDEFYITDLIELPKELSDQ
jgi:hypothetical protein